MRNKRTFNDRGGKKKKNLKKRDIELYEVEREKRKKKKNVRGIVK